LVHNIEEVATLNNQLVGRVAKRARASKP
jgi:hypothetical protein